MQFEYSDKVKGLIGRLEAFFEEHIYPNEKVVAELVHSREGKARWEPIPLIEELKPKARAAGLWNMFLPHSERGAGLTNLEYAPLCEIMGRIAWSSEVFNCSQRCCCKVSWLAIESKKNCLRSSSSRFLDE